MTTPQVVRAKGPRDRRHLLTTLEANHGVRPVCPLPRPRRTSEAEVKIVVRLLNAWPEAESPAFPGVFTKHTPIVSSCWRGVPQNSAGGCLGVAVTPGLAHDSACSAGSAGRRGARPGSGDNDVHLAGQMR